MLYSLPMRFPFTMNYFIIGFIAILTSIVSQDHHLIYICWPYRFLIYVFILYRYSVKVVQSFLKHWPTLAAQAGKTSLHQDSVLSLLSSLFLIDREGTIKSHCTSSRSDMVVFYNGLLADAKVELQAKIKVLKLLPFFFTMGEDIAKSVR